MFKNFKPSNAMIFLFTGALLLVVITFFIFFGVSSQLHPNLEKARFPVAEFSPSPNRSELFTGVQSDSSKKLVSSKITKINFQKIIRTGAIRFQVKDYQKSHVAITKIVKDFNGYIASEEQHNNDNNIENNLSLRIPAEQFDKFVESLLHESIYLNYKNIKANDVAAEFIDTETRLKTKRAVEERYLAILKQAQTITDILAVETQLSQIREDIEATEKNLKYLNDQIAYSTIDLTIYQMINRFPQLESGFWTRIGVAFINGWNSFISMLIGLIYLWPFILIIGLAILAYFRFKKKLI